ncbi:hypothetical protein B0H63DRAFT_489643 [Podospora didyma]|uniref:Uncharacterized protein n=1 Tax=Podospora didyma TaxID=330526 RepID=A0AAE0N2D2_9PEZI|nr:hypothetical protein B0H63DRAFT_489643 [Podospora didyma]
MFSQRQYRIGDRQSLTVTTAPVEPTHGTHISKKLLVQSQMIPVRSVSHYESIDSRPQTGTATEISSLPPRSAWRPTWLRRRVFVVFAIWFVALLATLEALAATSDRVTGIATPGEYLYYLWTFVPTALFITTAALWRRVNYQAQRFMPWIQLSEARTSPEKTVSLDYDSMLAPMAIAASFKNKHFLVMGSSIINLLLKVLVIMATGAFFLQTVDVAVDHASSPVPDTPKPANGTESDLQLPNKLVIQSAIAHIMTAILGISAIMLVLAVALFVPAKSFAPRDPETIPGALILLKNSRNFLRTMSKTAPFPTRGLKPRAGGACWTETQTISNLRLPVFVLYVDQNEKSDRRQSRYIPDCDMSWYQPEVLRLRSRVAIAAILLGLILGFAAMLSVSLRNDGLGAVEETTYPHYAPALLALVMVGIGFYLSYADSKTRALFPFFSLRQEPVSFERLRTSWADQLAVTALLRAVRYRAVPILLSTATSICAAFLVIFSSTVFTVVTVDDAATAAQGTSRCFTLNTVSAGFMLALLSAIFIMNIISAWVVPRGVVPKDPGTVANMASLTADSNVLDSLPAGAEWMSDAELLKLFKGTSFQMGWFAAPDGDMVYTIALVVTDVKEATARTIQEAALRGVA